MTQVSDMRGVKILFRTPMKWTIERLSADEKTYVNDYVVEQEIILAFVASAPTGENWWLAAVKPHFPESHTSMFLWFQKRFGRAHYRGETEEDDLDQWVKWNEGIMAKNPMIESIEILE